MSTNRKHFIRFDYEGSLLADLQRDLVLRRAVYGSLRLCHFTRSLCDIVWYFLYPSLGQRMTAFKNQQICADLRDAAEPIGYKQNIRGYRSIQEQASLYAINLGTLRLSRYRNHWTEQVLFVNSNPAHLQWHLMSGEEYENMQFGVKCSHCHHPDLFGEWVWIEDTLWLSTSPFNDQHDMFKYESVV